MKKFIIKKSVKTTLKVLICIWLIGAGFSMVKFQCVEPITTAIGVCRVLFLKEEMVTLQPYPKRILMTPQGTDKEIALLSEKFEENGYRYAAERRMGAGHAFVNGELNKIIGATNNVNGYYSLWVFNSPHEFKTVA